MNGSLIDDLLGQLQGAPAGQIAQQLGTDPRTAQDAIAAALPMIVGALGRNAQQPGGAGDLFSALQRHAQQRRHDGEREHGTKVVRPQQHQAHGHQRPQEGADGVQRLAQPEGGATLLGRRNVGHQRIARRAANAFANAVEQARAARTAASTSRPSLRWISSKGWPSDGSITGSTRPVGEATDRLAMKLSCMGAFCGSSPPPAVPRWASRTS